jgi:hypothetical protein
MKIVSNQSTISLLHHPKHSYRLHHLMSYHFDSYELARVILSKDNVDTNKH